MQIDSGRARRAVRWGMDLDATLSQLADYPATPVDLAELCLHLAADEYPDLDIPTFLARLDGYAEILHRRIAAGDSLVDKVAELAELLFEDEGFTGNATDYYDPRNSYLNQVLDRKLGLPITLSILAIAVGERAGLTVVGVGLPGHFVAKASEGLSEVIFDPFHGGQFLDAEGCRALVEAVTGRTFAAAPDDLAPAPAGFIVQRMLNNLKGVYLRGNDFPRAARVIGRLVQLLPADATQRRDLGVTLIQSGRPGAAIDHLRAYLAAEPSAADAEAVEEFLKEARRDVAQWN